MDRLSKMSSKHQDIWLWAFLGVFGFYAARAVHLQLLAMRAATQITKIDKPQDNISKGVENALKIETLWQLTRSSNQEIRAASIKIITDRVSQGTTYDLILEDIAGEDPKRRDKALKCLDFLCSSPGVLPASLFNTYTAIYACLNSLHSEMHEFETAIREKFEATGPGTSRRNGNRKKHCRDALNILAALLQHNCTDAISAGFVAWLIKYPFGGYEKPEEKKTIIADITSWYYEDPAMHSILSFVTNSGLRDDLVQRGVFDKKEPFEGESVETEWTWTYGGDVDVEPVVSSTMRGGRRMREESAEEQALRRRRREAMVLGEIGRPIERADIIERQNTTQEEEIGQAEEEIDREQEEPIVEVHEDEDVRERSWWNWRPW